ncbi:MAG: hypothetical protein JWQ90_4636 [Hydrocarboniphaga sp.]|uniref:GbsR/MarR family transcriptional regulator n=1 Tax=Hydrocarboniphaga sp. TaxID=2033016 RepID=UPI00260F91E3|nr:HTH domain-containing protein [Hydrocarboniphaga sp.]MDB5972186.1 hypothetical protein [Hydrocarboniphaga sp.]
MNIKKIVNIPASQLSEDELRFVDDMAGLLAPWGMAVMSGRVYGYLLLHQGPVSVNQIAADLQVSKVAAWNAARSLEEFGHVRRYGEPGSKRALYGPTDNFDVPMVKQCVLLGALGALLRNSASTVAKGETATRLRAMSQFYVSIQQAMEASIRDLNAKKSLRKR